MEGGQQRLRRILAKWNFYPYGSSTAYRKFSVTGWTQSRNWNYDYGAIQLNSPLGNTVGWFGFRWQSSNTFSGSYTVTGYPCDKPSGTMWRMSDNPGIRGVNTYHLFYQIDTYGCQSGSPVYHNYSSSCSTCSTAIHSYGTGQSPYPQYNSGTRITQSVFNNLVAWKITLIRKPVWPKRGNWANDRLSLAQFNTEPMPRTQEPIGKYSR